ncbi:hypothetical protein DEQ16_00495 [Dietzia maris]|nr:hypothetical protein DEQ16_00495 [Dietzia maris]
MSSWMPFIFSQLVATPTSAATMRDSVRAPPSGSPLQFTPNVQLPAGFHSSSARKTSSTWTLNTLR